MANSLKLTRDQLAKFLNDFEQIKQFERLFSLSDDYLNSGMIEDIIASIDALASDVSQGPEGADLTSVEARLQALEQLPRTDMSAIESRVSALEQAPRVEYLDWRGYATGWGQYVNTAATQTIVANVAEPLENNAGTIIETQKPYDIDTFYDGTVITGRNGDGVAIGIEFTYTPTSGSATSVSVVIDIGGAVGEVYKMEFPVLHGTSVPHKISYNVAAYTLDTWEANGGTVIIEADADGDIDDVRYVIHRIHRAIK